MPKPPPKHKHVKGGSHHARKKPNNHGRQVKKGTRYEVKHRADISRTRNQPYDVFLVLDFECTCEREKKHYPHEIIEFPVVAIDTQTGDVVSEFHTYCKPKINPILTDFCTELTGIRQEQVDEAPSFEEALQLFDEWYLETFPPETKTIFATDGDSDLRTFLYEMAVCRDGLDPPELFYSYINVKATFHHFFKVPVKRWWKLPEMLSSLSLRFEGHHHSGLDDARNIARLMHAMMKKGVVFSYPQSARYEGKSVSLPSSPTTDGSPSSSPKQSPTGATGTDPQSAIASPEEMAQLKKKVDFIKAMAGKKGQQSGPPVSFLFLLLGLSVVSMLIAMLFV